MIVGSEILERSTTADHLALRSWLVLPVVLALSTLSFLRFGGSLAAACASLSALGSACLEGRVGDVLAIVYRSLSPPADDPMGVSILSSHLVRWLTPTLISLAIPPLLFLAFFEIVHRQTFTPEMHAAVRQADVRAPEAYYAVSTGSDQAKADVDTLAARTACLVMDDGMGTPLALVTLDGRHPTDSLSSRTPSSSTPTSATEASLASSTSVSGSSDALLRQRGPMNGVAHELATELAAESVAAPASVPTASSKVVLMRRLASMGGYREYDTMRKLVERAAAFALTTDRHLAARALLPSSVNNDNDGEEKEPVVAQEAADAVIVGVYSSIDLMLVRVLRDCGFVALDDAHKQGRWPAAPAIEQGWKPPSWLWPVSFERRTFVLTRDAFEKAHAAAAGA